MKTFKKFIKEETMPYANVKSGVMDISDSAVRDQINQLLAGVTAMKFVTPYIALERVAKTLANFHIFLPSQGFLEGDSGAASWPIHQYGAKIGQTNDGEVVTTPAAQFSVFFEYRMADNGMYMIFCEVVDQEELEEIMGDLEDELNDEDEDVELDEESGYYYGKQPVSELKMSDEQQLDEISAEKVGKLKKAVDLEGKKLKTDKAKETLRTVHKKKWLASNVGVMKEDDAETDYVNKVLRSPSKTVPNPNADPETEKVNKVIQGPAGTKLDEVSKGTLASYIKKASHDVATKSAATRGFARDSKDASDKQDFMSAKKADERANKSFKKSWKRREGIAKAADKLAKEETEINEISSNLKARYVKKAEKDKAHLERQAAHSEYNEKHAQHERKKDWKDEAQWLKGIAAKRAKGISMAKKKD